ncbi:hypothetical protein GGR50DRAFT_507667 [Xylaria sp. CBS 124048]|nr:hypothetical protein GGR50DRAFT_507667 [Xylaria sp. CBS 124048]
MATFLEDPRLRQRWNQISQTTETVTENAAAGIWSFGHTYVTPCLASVTSTLDSCVTVCLGDREERARRARDRQRAREAAEFRFDFYDDWDEEFGGHNGGLLGGWRAEDWDRLVAGSGKRKGQGGEINEQPRATARGMNYGTRGQRRRASIHEDPTIIPRTAPLGFLARLPFKIGGTLRYKPSAANLQEHPGSMKHLHDEGEHEPLLGHGAYTDMHPDDVPSQTRKRSGTAGSGDTSDSFRSRGDLFPSDGEGEEDAVPLDDEFTITLDPADDRSSDRTKSSKGKRVAKKMSRSGSRATTVSTRPSLRQSRRPSFSPPSPSLRPAVSSDDLQGEDYRLYLEENEALERKRHVAANLALSRGLSRENLHIESVPEMKSELVEAHDIPIPDSAILDHVSNHEEVETKSILSPSETPPPVTPTSQFSTTPEFIPARLPHFR